MYWKFGGNFKPVATTCQNSEWTNCVMSFIRYIWFEVVTDVVDCLANEEVIWRALTLLLTLTTIAYFVYWKSQWKGEVNRNQERFTTVNHKIQDLELKVDIVTYKTQYGIWPLQYLQEKNTLANLKHFQFGLSKFTLENSWIKNILSGANENKCFLEKYSVMQKNMRKCSDIDKTNFLPLDNDNKLLSQEQYCPTIDAQNDATFNYNSEYQNNVDSNLDEPLQCLDASRINWLIVPPESNFSDCSMNYRSYTKKHAGCNNNSSRRQSMALSNATLGPKRTTSNKKIKTVVSTTNMTVNSKTFTKFQGDTFKISSKNNQFFSKSHDTLLGVQEKLETLYKTIHNYNTQNSELPIFKLNSHANPVDPSQAILCAQDKSNEKMWALDDSNESSKNIIQNIFENSNSTKAVAYESPSFTIESKINGNHTNYYSSEKTCDRSLQFSSKNNENFGNFDNQRDKMDTHRQILELHSIKSSNSINTFKDKIEDLQIVEPLDNLTSALLRETSKLKTQILSKVELQDDSINVKKDYDSNCTETSSDTSLKQDNAMFESKFLDMITEESSTSSRIGRKGFTNDYNILEDNNISQDKIIPLNEKNKRSHIKTTSSSVEIIMDERNRCLRDLNSPSKINNKSFNGESSSNRIFSSSFSTAFLCNDQDSSNICKQTNNDTTVEAKSSEDLISLTRSSSDVSVNKLINKLIENERKLKINKLSKFEKTTTNGSLYDSKNSNDVKLTNPLIKSTHPTVNYNDPIKDTKYNDILNDDASRMECLKEIAVVPKKFNDSIHDFNDNENYHSSEINTNVDNFLKYVSIPKIKFQNSEINEIDEPLLKNNANSSINKHCIYSDSSVNEKLIKNQLSSTRQNNTLQTSKEADKTFDSISFSNAEKLGCNIWKPSRAKSNLSVTAVDKCHLKLTHRRSKSYTDPRGLTDISKVEKKDFLETSFSSQLTSIKVFSTKSNFNNDVDIKKTKSSESFFSISSLIPISKSISLKGGQMKLKTDYSSPEVTDITMKNCIKKATSLSLIPRRYPSSKSCISIINNSVAHQKNLGKILLYSPKPTKISTINSSQNKAQDLINQVETDIDKIDSLLISEEKPLSEQFTKFSKLDTLKNIEQNAIIYYNLVSEDQHVSNNMNQNDSSNMPIQELIIAENVVSSRAIDTALATPNTINETMTCKLPEKLSELNPLNSIIFQNFIPPISPYQIERKETEVLVKPSTLDISTSMTNFPCVYHFDEVNKMNDLKIFEISDELTKEECIRYLQMFDEDSNCDQSTNTHDLCNKLLDSG